jgi:hypothetical protein
MERHPGKKLFREPLALFSARLSEVKRETSLLWQALFHAVARLQTV